MARRVNASILLVLGVDMGIIKVAHISDERCKGLPQAITWWLLVVCSESHKVFTLLEGQRTPFP